MTRLSAILGLLFLAVPLPVRAADWRDDYDRLLRKYVLPDGVLYQVWKAEPADVEALDGVVQAIAAAPEKDVIDAESKAFFINAYNAWILREALVRFPLKSVNDIPDFFEEKRIEVAGRRMSFNELEKDILMKRFLDPRVHFALNCASASCPPLAQEPYAAEGLDLLLDKRTVIFVNSEKGVQKTGEGYAISKVFDWYAKDFEKTGGVIAFINRYRSEVIPEDAKLSVMNYDWSLNAKDPINQ